MAKEIAKNNFGDRAGMKRAMIGLLLTLVRVKTAILESLYGQDSTAKDRKDSMKEV